MSKAEGTALLKRVHNTWREVCRGYAKGYLEGVHGGVCRGGTQRGTWRSYMEGVHGGVYRGGMQPGNIEGVSLLSIVTIGCPYQPLI